ncbi:hypothetical protein [Candidatus Enterococcus mansonii]|uniref:hypothetical protein n=1 Tax=Candidatus Enterococcus mansonii TaxID=1834181 RepID=UPI003AF63494
MILLNNVSKYQTYLRLKKRRFFCQSCNRSFVAETSLVEKCCSISTKVKLAIADRLTLPQVLCFDEFKSVKQAAASISFIMMDGRTKQLIDALKIASSLF